ncbi:YhdH/YhfP family quinone oxidoreductase [Desulfoprunum benzoelyticum]|uniref:Putative YhdH/YhfP family quinone oxidoreductase n=1 Tax=Desulfoprunum benzoelyticum TaxID=1506996 RepID=A0A840UPS8_9BACT|nr:YhdH/YhfP family quinone oxidoreductase [Desulfoprunum benzoelyticum]MBB5346846.1 putative YhdH/YhfP family quinone oxidoreductase [Desulfoprunum benzoelyticum]MBM9529492.1 YhdH/YhfP family quinone oxidoreductase [Desulfoprunum benzoelyticum]
MATMFLAMVVEEQADGSYTRTIRERTVDDLPAGEVLIRVLWSSLNYKDALSASGNKGVTRKYPHTPGIDAAGIVEDSRNDRFRPGDQVLVTSYDLGMNTAGGFGQYIRVPADWVVSLPAGLELRESMVLGTAGLTAAMSITALRAGIGPEQGEILVTGASGGVGSMAVSILARLGYEVCAASGKDTAYLLGLGAKSVVARAEVDDAGDRPLLKTRWAGVIDTVGGNILATAIRSTAHKGIVTCCGNVASPDLQLTVFPFILRGVTLVGIDSQNLPMEERAMIWQRLAHDWKPAKLGSMGREVSLAGLEGEIARILQGGQKGRIVVNLGQR